MERPKILLYSPGITPRLRYIASHMLERMAGARVVLTANRDEAASAALPLINYCTGEIPGAVNMVPYGLLGERDIRMQDTGLLVCRGLPGKPAEGNSSAGNRSAGNPVAGNPPDGKYVPEGFDLFSAAFYMLSRYEEYLSDTGDRHGRFPFSESLACRHSFAAEPLVDLWAISLMEMISRIYPGVKFPEREFLFIPTIDIDIPWAYRNRGVFRTLGGFARSLMKADMRQFVSRYRVLCMGDPDPYDTFDLIGKIHEDAGLLPVFFFHAGRYGKFDKSVSAFNGQYRQLIREISARYPYGLHPSYSSFDDPGLTVEEAGLLAGITGEYPFRSRQHYLRLRLPGTCRTLIDSGIKEDYTLGWAEVPGFRAGTCTPFMFYDLELEQETSLRMVPFQIMDGTLKDYMGLEPDEASEVVRTITGKVRDVNGTLVTLWHNESFSGTGHWKNWKKVYLEIIEAAKK